MIGESNFILFLKSTLTYSFISSLSLYQGDENLQIDEFNEIWDRTPKFPEDSTLDNTLSERIDVDSWVQLYRDIDDLFEDEKDDDVPREESNKSRNYNDVSYETIPINKSNEPKAPNIDVVDVHEIIDVSEEKETSELDEIFEFLCTNGRKMISKSDLYQWDEIVGLISDGLLGDDEFNEIWTTTPKSDNSQQFIDLRGFHSFNAALDSLFEMTDEEADDFSTSVPSVVAKKSNVDGNNQPDPAPSSVSQRMVDGNGLDPEVLFVALADSNGFVGRKELESWSELNEMLSSGDLLLSELDSFFDNAEKSENDATKLTMDGFVSLYQSINDLFVDEDDEQLNAPAENNYEIGDDVSVKSELLEAIEDLNDDNNLPCGLDADDRERKQILAIVDEIESEAGNLVRQRRGAIEPADIAGTWELLYSSSSAMKFNKGLSGLGGSFPNGRFGSLKQTLKASKFMMDVEYIEHIQVKPSTASFDVTINGSWDLRRSTSLFTGEPSIVMIVEPNRVSYGPTSTRADHWKSLGPMNMLDITYLDNDLRIMRGNTAIETIFIFRRQTSILN